jgi:hypothetical protein
MWYSSLREKTLISRRILHQHWYTCSIALSARRNLQHGYLCFCRYLNRWLVRASSATFERTWENISTRLWTALPDKHFPSFFYKQETSSPFAKKKTHNRTLLFGSVLLKHGHHFEYWNQPLNMRMLVRYLDCHEAGLCCYLMVTQKTYYLLQLFTFICDLFTEFPSYDTFCAMDYSIGTSRT